MQRNNENGQGIVEYSGALVVSTLLVAVALAANFSSLSGLFDTVIGRIAEILINTLTEGL